MEQLSNNAQTRLAERAFTIQEEAGGNEDEAFRLWHKLRPLFRSARGKRIGIATAIPCEPADRLGAAPIRTEADQL